MEVTAQIQEINAPQVITDKFTKREFIAVVEHTSNYPKPRTFTLVNKNCSIIDNFNIGDVVTLSFNMDGRAAGGKVYNTDVVWKITK